MNTPENLQNPPQYDAEMFSRWFCENNDIPDDVYPFETMDNGTYAWKETRDGLAQWLELQKAEKPA